MSCLVQGQSGNPETAVQRAANAVGRMSSAATRIMFIRHGETDWCEWLCLLHCMCVFYYAVAA